MRSDELSFGVMMMAGLLLRRVSASECLLGFALKGLDPFESTEWVGLSVCDDSRAGCTVVTNTCSASSLSCCFWSIVEDGSDADDDGACSCQSCGGLPSDMDEYMTELSFWDRARCAIYALEITGYDVTPCVEALVDDKVMPGVNDSWTGLAVSRFDCLTVDSFYWDDPECSYPTDTPRLAAEMFDSKNTSTPAPGSTASPAIVATVSESTVECLLGFALQGLDPFESTEWVGLSVCDDSRAGCEVITNTCSASSLSCCFWSIVDDGSDADDDGACSCQSCGGLPSDMDEYMTELAFWDRARCAIYALEITGYNVTPCVEALVDDKVMPGVNDSWTGLAVSRFDCLTVDSFYWDDPECSYPTDTPRLASEMFDSKNTSTPAPGSTASPAIVATVSESTVECLLGFALQGLDPFESTEWVGLSVCDDSRAGCEVITNTCSASSLSCCFWSIVDDGSDADDDGACSCQSCGGLPSDMDEYMTELSFWDRARCAIYALEITGYDVTPCVEALVDDKVMPGVNDSWTALAVSRFDCLTVDSFYWDDPECSFSTDTPRLAAEMFDSKNTSTPAPGTPADIFATPGPAQPPLDAVGTTPWPTTAPRATILERTLNPTIDSTEGSAAHPSYSGAKSDGTLAPVDAGSLDPRDVSPSESVEVSSSGPTETVYSGPVGGSSGVTASSSSSTLGSYSDAVDTDIDDRESTSSESSGNDVFEIVIGIASVFVAVVAIIVGVRYRT